MNRKARPRILVTMDLGERLRRGVPLKTHELKAAYADRIVEAGGTPLLAAPTTDKDVLADHCEWMEGLVVTGGAFDIPPEYFGQARNLGVRLDESKLERTHFEAELIRSALARDVPMLCVCGGMQLLNVVRGGTLLQDIRAMHPEARDHEQPTSPQQPNHSVRIEGTSSLAQLVGAHEFEVNSTHHQAVDVLGEGLEVLGRADDDIIEAIGLTGDPSLRVLGVQWHPELLSDTVSIRIYRHFVDMSARPRR
ncbi:MAG: gamma-glutamyl-gamma-aminobutyrate hydrolase family protein [Deltaproteobacteria bacterium]|nr:gamma-glutamyl-gamma-aminobutyrate hydrolase family protein [Deltaproteobacteria bacterium]